jgi:hypothetical protein
MIQVIYHVAVLMDSEQQRRLIGNDITYLFFHDSQEPFPTSLVNGFGQVPQMFLVVQKIKDNERYRYQNKI